jgi:hypothetical protein
MPGTDGDPTRVGGRRSDAPALPTLGVDGAMGSVGAGPSPPKHLWPERHSLGSVP